MPPGTVLKSWVKPRLPWRFSRKMRFMRSIAALVLVWALAFNLTLLACMALASLLIVICAVAVAV